jgi:hypothetical protein
MILFVPLDPGRDEARDAAVRELSDPVYRAAEPSWFDRAVGWLLERIGELFTGIGSLGPGGIVGLLVLIGLAVLLMVIIRHRVGRLARARPGPGAVFEGRALTAADHRRAAELAAQQGNLAEAVRERFRAIVRELEQRGVLDEVSGRTVDEIATQAGQALPASAAELRATATIFDDVVYGDRPALPAAYQRLVQLDDDIQGRRSLLGASR